ncbi:MAG: hypothetical protein H0X28_06310 [Solirubrobacterales bacterium]|nr:hypothetical protein [Solirubrobacterales bacterium]
MSQTAETHPTEQELQQELASLRARVASLESELIEVQTRANTAVAQWQERAYWLDRWHLDLNALMRRPGASEFRSAVRALRSVVWTARRVKRRLTQS